MKAILIFFLSCITLTLTAQTGNYFLSHYSPGEKPFDNVCFDMAQDKKGVMYFATKAGLLEFDGRSWDLLPGRSAIYSLQITTEGNIYWAGAKGFGKVSVDDRGFQKIELLSDSLASNVFQTLAVNQKVYFLTEDLIYFFDENTKNISTIKPYAKEHTLQKLFELFGQVYVSTDHGNFKIENDKLVAAEFKLNQEIIFSSKVGDNYVVGTGNNKIFTCGSNLRFKKVFLQDSLYLNSNVIVNGTWVNAQMLAIGTLTGGVVFVNPITGATRDIINYSTGLPDNEVFQLITDMNRNVWVAHDYGFTKISPHMPLGAFTHYEGLQGNLLCAFSANNTVYVGTSLGLFRLEKVNIYDDLTYYVNVEIKPSKKSTAQPKEVIVPEVAPQNDEQTKRESKKGGMLSFLRKNKKSTTTQPAEDQTISPAKEAPNTNSKTATRYRRVKKTEKVLKSSYFVFKKVQGIDAKVTHITTVGKKLLAAGLGGLYEVEDLRARLLFEEPIRHMFSPLKSDILIISTYDDVVRSLSIKGNSIENASLFSSPGDQINYIFQGNNDIWFCGVEKLYRAELKGEDIRHKQTIPLLHANSDKTIGTVLNNEVVLANADGFYHFNRTKNAIEKIDSLPSPSQYFTHNGGIVYRDQHGWQFLGITERQTNFQLLNVFQDLRFIASDKNPNHLWLISGNNELYKFFGDKPVSLDNQFPIFLKEVVNKDRKVVQLKGIQVDQENSQLQFEVVQPDYVNPQSVEFRYLLKGMQANWSEWSSNSNVISFPYLPTGEYTLEVQARNIFGKISTLEPLVFEVLPPYWKRPWFYALEFTIFATLVMLSFRLSTRYRIVSRLLSLLTIILFIEFIQTAIGATILTEDSPVIDFFIQVVVAFLVLPVEGYLRNLMLRSLDSSGKFYQFIVPGSPLKKERPEIFVKETSDLEK